MVFLAEINKQFLEESKMKEIITKSAEDMIESLSTIMNKKLNIISVDILDLRLEDVIQKIGKPDDMHGCIQVEIFGKSEIKNSMLGHFLLLMDHESMKKFISLAGREESDGFKKHLDFFREVGNITSGSFLRLISESLKFEFRESLPDFCYDMLGSCMDSVLCSIAATSEKSLIFKAVIGMDGLKMNAMLLFYPDIYNLIDLVREPSKQPTFKNGGFP